MYHAWETICYEAQEVRECLKGLVDEQHSAICKAFKPGGSIEHVTLEAHTKCRSPHVTEDVELPLPSRCAWTSFLLPRGSAARRDAGSPDACCLITPHASPALDWREIGIMDVHALWGGGGSSASSICMG